MTASNFAKIHAQLSYNLKKYTVHDEANEKRRQEPTFHYWHAWNTILTMELPWVLFSLDHIVIFFSSIRMLKL